MASNVATGSSSKRSVFFGDIFAIKGRMYGEVVLAEAASRLRDEGIFPGELFFDRETRGEEPSKVLILTGEGDRPGEDRTKEVMSSSSAFWSITSP